MPTGMPPEYRRELQERLLAESLAESGTQRHGYIGFMHPLAVCDDSKAPKSTFHPQHERLQPVNFLTTEVKKGRTPEVYFSYLPSLHVGDPYKDSNRRKGRGGDEAVFKPSGTVPYPVNKTGYPYTPEGMHIDKKALCEYHKQRVPIRGVWTAPPKKGGKGHWATDVLLGPLPAYMESPFDGWKETRR
uniref:Uncharacterized protein n=1 Tax=Chromera velia CCMP2878 TaxID=1169474 RepID=A0A0G4FNU6_9ALVE|eukprot:Cvel_17826.t1-p1 / transcript=Cvel_17826.t1 / gene=Cvel_17826 / organism=Chromera_velia_CCMP2878 / gene_product=hypothetical protein / transcript_product=hypothetical protein / location=Cvel_scaffold1444:35213-36265(+) / protein_length=187 / sequence_SO=supercontig / SO=protein_coding / is_pseudo=false